MRRTARACAGGLSPRKIQSCDTAVGHLQNMATSITVSLDGPGHYIAQPFPADQAFAISC